eukprot:9057571-Pyramimonas_sp.AAC.1
MRGLRGGGASARVRGGNGKSCDMAIWKQALMNEATRASNLFPTQALPRGCVLSVLKGPNSVPRPGQFPQDLPLGSPSYVPLA